MRHAVCVDVFAEKRADIGIAFHSVAFAFLCFAAKSATVTKIRVASASAETIQMTMYRRLKLSTTKAKLFSINTYIHKQARELQPEGDETEQAGHGREHAVATMQSKAAKGDIGGRQVR